LILVLFSADTTAVFRGVDRVVLKWNVSDVRVASHDEPYVEIRWSENSYRVDFEREGRNLNIDVSPFCGGSEIVIFGIPLCNDDVDRGSVEVLIPSTIKLLAMNGKVGTVDVEGFRGDTLNVNVGILYMGLRNSRIPYMKVNSSIGAIEMDGVDVDLLDSNMGIGSMEGRKAHIGSRRVKFLIGTMSLD